MNDNDKQVPLIYQDVYADYDEYLDAVVEYSKPEYDAFWEDPGMEGQNE